MFETWNASIRYSRSVPLYGADLEKGLFEFSKIENIDKMVLRYLRLCIEFFIYKDNNSATIDNWTPLLLSSL